MAIDQGTTSSRVILFELNGEVVATFRREFSCFYPQSGWVEQDANAIWQDCFELCNDAFSYASEHNLEIASIGIANQRETVVFFDKETQQAICPAIVWQDRRTTSYCEQLIADGHSKLIRNKTGLVIDAYFSASKIRWGLKNNEDVKQALSEQRLAIGTIDSWLLFKLSGGAIHATDTSNASRTMLFDIGQQRWCNKLLELFEVPKSILPQVLNTVDDYQKTAISLFGQEVPIRALIGDQQAATIGQGCLNALDGKCTLGTGAFAMRNIGTDFSLADNGLLTTILFSRDGLTHFATEGSIFSSGSTIQWLRDSLKIVGSAPDTERIAASINDTGGVYFVPAFSGLGSPYWQPHARASISGMSGATTRAEIIRAALESVSYQCFDLFGGSPPKTLLVDGGMAANDWLLQHLADILQCTISRPTNLEATAWGAARCAGAKFGLLEELPSDTISADSFNPQMPTQLRDEYISEWHAAVAACLHNDA
jgi:glycerol kinase